MTSSLTPIASAARKAPKPKKRKSNGLRNARPPTASRLYQDTYISFRVPGTPVMAGSGPRQPTLAVQQVGSYLGYTGRAGRSGSRGSFRLDPKFLDERPPFLCVGPLQ